MWQLQETRALRALQGTVTKNEATLTGETAEPPRKLDSQEIITKGDGMGSTEGVPAEKNG